MHTKLYVDLQYIGQLTHNRIIASSDGLPSANHAHWIIHGNLRYCGQAKLSQSTLAPDDTMNPHHPMHTPMHISSLFSNCLIQLHWGRHYMTLFCTYHCGYVLPVRIKISRWYLIIALFYKDSDIGNSARWFCNSGVINLCNSSCVIRKKIK